MPLPSVVRAWRVPGNNAARYGLTGIVVIGESPEPLLPPELSPLPELPPDDPPPDDEPPPDGYCVVTGAWDAGSSAGGVYAGSV